MTKKHGWYERLFFGLQLREKACWLVSIGLLLLIMAVQLLLTDEGIRRELVLIERLEGHPVKFNKSLSHK